MSNNILCVVCLHPISEHAVDTGVCGYMKPGQLRPTCKCVRQVKAVTKEITLTLTWESTVTVSVPDDFTVPDMLSDFPQSVTDQFTTYGAVLVDWSE